ncbi:tetratricopeptide repeat protein [Flavimaricola marinus]|uniref:Tetratricopeptide repeat protein n=1 Tax=Flavimaricola marinus TaxID=1819565 RepID=A0A238LL21_9RHOB|nr:hypothetical protein [Flavimaricola marinus]SMY10371.1 Tetratricopeptide repeat protein [Flavimaricola marinus]
MKTWLTFALCLIATPVLAQDSCPAVPDRDAEKAQIYRDLRISRDATDARLLSDELWRIWLVAPDARAQDLLDDAMRLRREANFEGSIELLDELVEYCPHYAEGYNQRAFSNFLRREFGAALLDLNAALDIDPLHLGALTGKALSQMGLGQDEAAQQSLRKALRLNPWLAERSLLTGPPEQEL